MGKDIHEQCQEIAAEMDERGHVQSSAPHLFVNSDIYDANCTFKVRHKSDNYVANSHGVQCVGALVTAATITISVEGHSDTNQHSEVDHPSDEIHECVSTEYHSYSPLFYLNNVFKNKYILQYILTEYLNKYTVSYISQKCIFVDHF